MDWNFDHQMSLSKSKCLYSNNCLHFLKCPVPLAHLSDASFLGKLLVLPANVRLDWKVFARCKHSSLFGLIISNKEKKFYNIDSRFRIY